MKGLLLFLVCSMAWSNTPGPVLPDKGVLSKDSDSFFDPRIDYSIFPARITDKDELGQIFKVQAETKNVKFFRSGDKLEFIVNGKEKKDPCIGFIRGVEKDYFIMHVSEIDRCWHRRQYFRRGMMIRVFSPALQKRVHEASFFRLSLLEKRDDYLNQLNDKNNFLWSFKQKQIQVAAQYDKRILQLQKEKQKALDNVLARKKETAMLQKELIKKLDQVDQDLEFFRVNRQDIMADRWVMDQDLGLPIGRRPQEKIKAKAPKHRWDFNDFK